MKKRYLTHLMAMFLTGSLALLPSLLNAQGWVVENWEYDPDKELNPNTTWLREARWGLYTHYKGTGQIRGRME